MSPRAESSHEKYFPINKELKILEDYKNGKIVDPSDLEIIDELAMVGFIRRGVSLKMKKPTAKTTTLGLSFVQDMKMGPE